MESTQPVNRAISMPADRDSGENMRLLQQELLAQYRIELDSRPKSAWRRYLCIAMGAVPGAAALAAGTVMLVKDINSVPGTVMALVGLCAMWSIPACIHDWPCPRGGDSSGWGGGAGAAGI